MRPLNRKLLLGVLPLLLAGLTAARPAQEVELKLALEWEEYKLSENIDCEFQLWNRGDRPIWVNKRFKLGSEKADPRQKELVLLVKEASGAPVEMKTFDHETGFPKSDFFVQLKPGEKAAADRKWNLKDLAKIEKPGEYELTAVYQNTYGKELGLDAFKQKITGSVKFRVTEG